MAVIRSPHSKMILDKEQLMEISKMFYEYIWIIGLNVTEELFYTSDNPIGTISHLYHPILSMSSLNSEGVEVYIPLSPKAMLLMFDKKYHRKLKKFDKKYIYLNDKEIIRNYNRYSTINSGRCIYSSDGNFELIEEMISKNPDVFRQPKLELNFAGKTYHPKR